MDPQTPVAPRLCPCACPFCCRPASSPFRRSVKRRVDPEPVATATSPSGSGDDGDVAARVEVDNEVTALREMVATQQEAIQDLYMELEEERNAAASAASETMSMILRLQNEKAEAQMEARQFQRFAEEKMDHDQQELVFLEDLLFRRDEAVRSLTFQLEACRQRLVSCGVDPTDVEAEVRASQFDDLPTFCYPPLKCTVPNDVPGEDNYDEAAYLETYAFRETPHASEDLENLEQRICQLEALPVAASLMEKGVIEERTGPSNNFGRSAAGSHASVSDKNSQETTKGEYFPASTREPMDDDAACDDTPDRVYTIDAVHGVPAVGVADDFEEVPMVEKGNGEEIDGEPDGGSPDIKILHMRLQALEADRESMRQAIMSMQTEKAQLVLLREIAQQLSKEAVPERRIVPKNSSTVNSSLLSLTKWILAFILWRKKASRTKYTFGLSNSNVGLMVLLDKTPRISNWKRATRLHG